MREESLPLRGAPIRTLPRPNRVWRAGRVCAEPGCTTRLSIYNRSDSCWMHEPEHDFVMRGRKKRPEAA